MLAAQNGWRFTGRWIVTAAKNTVLRTGVTLSIFLYVVLAFIIGSFFFVHRYGADKFMEQWQAFGAYTLVGIPIAWAIMMAVQLVLAPFQMHREDHATLAGTLATRESETAAQFTLLREELRHAVLDRDDAISERNSLRFTLSSPRLTVGDVKEWMYDLARDGRAISSTRDINKAKTWLADATLKINKWLRKHQSDVFERMGNHLLTYRCVNDEVRSDNMMTECPAWIERVAGVLEEHDIRPITMNDALAVSAA
jgi:hypothetical protein